MGHCVLYCAEANVCFCGDLIFAGSVGRTDLPGGDWDTLEKSIREQIYTLPNETRLFSGHGPETTVGEEKQFNPFVRVERITFVSSLRAAAGRVAKRTETGAAKQSPRPLGLLREVRSQ